MGVGHLHRSQALARVSKSVSKESRSQCTAPALLWPIVGGGRGGTWHRHLPVRPLVSLLLLGELIYSTGINWEPGFRIRDLAMS